MVFSDLFFLFVFLPAFFACYMLAAYVDRKWLSSHKLRNACLVLFSLLFYAWGEPVYVFLMLALVFVNFHIGKFIDTQISHRKLALNIGVITNVLALGVFKYAMLYDRHLMQALFQLQIGNPGSSFAVEIARKIGLPEEVIADASEIVGSEYINADKYLQDIVRDKRYWETKRQNIRKREKQMEDIIAKYEAEMVELEKNRKAILRKAKEDAEHLLQESNAKIENTIRTIKEAQAEKEKTRLARQELSDFKGQIDDINKQNEEDKIAQKMQKLREKQERKKDKKNQPQAAANAPKPVEPKAKPIEKGSIVKIKGQTGVGQVLDISGKTAIVSFGMIKTNVKIDRLEVTDAPIQKANAVSSFVSSKTQDHVYEKKLEFKQDIDVRGMRGDEAIQAVTYFIDDAILLGISRVRILHGTGNGILRTLIRNYLSGVPGVAHFQDEHVQFGGAGITVVDLD